MNGIIIIILMMIITNHSINLKIFKKNENINNFKSIVTIKKDDGKWFKVCLYNETEDKYYFRTITCNDIEWQRREYKELINYRMINGILIYLVC